MPAPSLRLWRYSINYGPNGEQNYANVFDDDGRMVGNLAIDHAIKVVTSNNEVEELRYLQSEVDQGEHIIRKRERERCAEAAKRAVLTLPRWPVSEEQAEEIARTVRGLGDE